MSSGNNRDKKKLFTQRARLSNKNDREDSSKLSISRFANDRNKVYVSKKKIEIHKKEKSFKTKYDRLTKKEEINTNIPDIYKQIEENDPMSRFAVGDDSKYESIENDKKNKRNKKKENIVNNDNKDDNDQEMENDNDNENNKDKNNNNKINEKEKEKEKENSEKQQQQQQQQQQPQQPQSVQKQFKNAKYQYEKEKKERQELFKQIQEKKEKTKKQIQERNKEKFGTILKKTKKGQPVLSNQINKLLSKIIEDNK